MLKVYPAVIHEEDGFWIEFPDLEGCQTVGDTLEELIANAQEALGLYIVSLIENGQPIPEPSKFDTVAKWNVTTTYITADIDKYRRDTRAVKNVIH